MLVKLFQKTKIIFLVTIIFSITSILTSIISLKKMNAVNIQNIVYMASTDNGAYYSNVDNSYMNTANGDSADPTITKGPDGCFYVFTTNKHAYRSCDSKNWDNWDYYFDETNSKLPNYQYFWAPEIYQIGNYYYMIFSIIRWGSGYPGASDSFGANYYARSTDLKRFEVLGEMPYGSSYFDGKVSNKNHVDGSLLNDDGKYYYYFKMENQVRVSNDNYYQGEEIYGIQVNLGSDGKFYSIGNPQILMRRNTESNPLSSNNFTWWCWQNGNFAADTEDNNEGPFIVKRGNKYYLTYSVGQYTNDSYHVVSATSNSPLGPFVRDKLSTRNNQNENQLDIRDFISGANYPSTAGTDYSRNSSVNIYSTGHGSILTLNLYDTLVGNYNEYYYVYHSNRYKNGTFDGRKITIDGVNFTDDLMFVNGPTTDIQPLISGSKIGDTYYYKIPSNKFKINNEVLKDGIKYNAMNIKKNVSDYNTNTLNISFTNEERIDLSDVWVYGNGSNIGSLSGTMYINEGTRKSTQQRFDAIVTGSNAKIQIPKVDGKVKNIRIVFDKWMWFTEVELVRNSQDNFYQVTFNHNGGSINKAGNFNNSNGYAASNGLIMYDNSGIPSISLAYNSVIFNDLSGDIPTRSGYTFKGWYTAPSGGTQVYDSNGRAINGNGYWSNNLWVKKSDVVLYAQWTPINYSITYTLNGGSVTGNPTNYNAETNTFTLKNPTKSGYKFTGWSGTGINGKSTSVTISKGSVGNRTYTANFELEALKISNYTVSDKYIYGIKINTDASKLNLGLNTGYTYKIYDKDGKQKTSGKMVTGDTVKIYSGSNLHVSYRVIIKGDVTGNGTSTVGDVAKLYQYLKGKIKMDDVYIKAGNVVSTDNVIKINDVAKLYQFIKGKISNLD